MGYVSKFMNRPSITAEVEFHFGSRTNRHALRRGPLPVMSLYIE